MKKRIRLAIVDDQQLFRKGLIALIREFEDLEIIIEARNGKELMELLKVQQPDVLLLDLKMPEMDGFRVTEQLGKLYPEIRILVLSMYLHNATLLWLLEKGARGFLFKDSDISTVTVAISSVMETGYYFNDHISQKMVKELMRNNTISPDFTPVVLSLREIEIIRLICQELTNKEIAMQLFISARTVDGHKEKILRKTKAKNVIGIVMYAVRNHLLE
ncbi:MAG: response regulator transcription factor [Bacteroidetes bacterium]|nr:response regulator transcription factor [Bacteroidota bacterium]